MKGMIDLVGKVVYIQGALWRVVCIRDADTVEVIAHPNPLIWAAPRSFPLDMVGQA